MREQVAIAQSAGAEGTGGKKRARRKKAAPASERRKVMRRDPSKDRLEAFRKGTVDVRSWLPFNWVLLAASMLVAVTIASVASSRIPPLVPTILIGIAIAGIAATPRLRAYEYTGETKGRVKMAAFCLVIPMTLFGGAISYWWRYFELTGGAGLSLLLFVGMIAAAFARRHVGTLFASQMGMWLPALIIAQSLFGLLAFVVAAISAVLIARDQLQVEEDEQDEDQARIRAQARARNIIADYEETGQGWFWETDRRGQLSYISAPIAKTLGTTSEDLLGKPLTALFDLGDAKKEGERTLAFHFTARSAFNELPVRAAVEGEDRWWSVSGRPVYDSFDNFAGFRGSGTDLTEKKRSQDKATRLAQYDSLTGLANRHQMAQSLEKILTSPQEKDRACAVLLLDLDRFKVINDTMGHPAGDALLKQVAQRLERTVGAMGRVGRLGGDEFKVIIPKRTERDRLAQLAQDIINTLTQPYVIDGQSVNIGASVGIALFPDNADDSETLIRNADLALYAAKDNGRGRFFFYAEDLHAEAKARAALEKDLREALVKGGLELNYQPVIAAAEEKITGFEALLRWNHPEKGRISPEKFVKIAEETGLIEQIGEWALRTACHDLAKWPDDVRCAVNVSPLQFANPKLPAIITSAIAEAGIPAHRLELEITESVFLSDDANTDAMFAALKKVGVRLALDDFGTGYSSLGYLKKAPFDKIKIDQSFVRGATEPGSRNGAIIQSITSLAHALGMDTTAEGVETLDELDLVRVLGCSHIQGYIYDKPLSMADATERLRTGLDAKAQGPKSARAPRQMMLRKVLLEHAGQVYSGTIRNISVSGALIEGLWNVPPGTIFDVQISSRRKVRVTSRWAKDDKMGVEFTQPLERAADGSLLVLQESACDPIAGSQRKSA
ncbi:EAL domain-containing protein [Paraurantiacibacter namhicola]|nr:EAL domain-containing protein [Paraurantiacibacter namhicola]